MGRSSLQRALLLGVIVLGAAMGPAAVASATVKARHLAPHVLTQAPACPSADTCVSIPNDPPNCTGTSCATVQAGPTRNLGDDQFVYLNTYGFSPGSDLHVNYCTDTAALPTPPLCLTSGNALISNTDYVVQSLSDGSESLSYQVLDVETSDPPLVGQDPGDADIKGSFFCNAQSPCSIDVTDTSQDNGSFATLANNTAVIPVTFTSNQSPGCEGTAANVNTESEFGIEFLLPFAAADSCKESDPSIAFNTAVDGLGAVTALAAGGVQVAFTDDPESPSQQQVLTQGNYKLIPVALTANVVGFRAQQFQDQFLFPLNNLDLTPNMVAGLLTGIYNTPVNNDPISCSLTVVCASPPCPALSKKKIATNPCSLFNQLNYEEGFLPPQGYESFMRSDTSGSTGLLFNWLCNAPLSAVDVPGASALTESRSAAKVLEDAFATVGGGALSTCPDYDQLPPEALGSTVSYNAYDDPDQQSIKMFSYVNPGGGGSNVLAAFSTMNWAEARYYGLSLAALQNGAGKFVLPTQSSLDAAVLDDPTVNPDGSIAPNYSATGDTAIYPMTSVVYAAVCADPVPTAQASAESEMLSQLLNITGGADSGQLPDGFVPLPSSLVSRAQANIAADLVGGGPSNVTGCPKSSTPGPATGPSSTPSPTHAAVVTGGIDSGHEATGSKAAPVAVPGPQTLHFGSTGLNGKAGTGGSNNGAGGSPRVGLFSLASSSSRLLLPLTLLLGLLALLLGVFMLVLPGFRAQVLAFSLNSGKWVKGVSRRTGRGVRGARSWISGSLSEPKRRW
jgi:hypothetical protein